MSRRPAGDSIDVHVGKRVRERRVQLGMSQKALAEEIGVSFQQIQKNERGTNRIGASRIYELSKVLDVPVSFFFDDLPPQPPVERAPQSDADALHDDALSSDILSAQETQELIQAFYRIDERTARKRLLTLMRGLHKQPKA